MAGAATSLTCPHRRCPPLEGAPVANRSIFAAPQPSAAAGHARRPVGRRPRRVWAVGKRRAALAAALVGLASAAAPLSVLVANLGDPQRSAEREQPRPVLGNPKWAARLAKPARASRRPRQQLRQRGATTRDHDARSRSQRRPLAGARPPLTASSRPAAPPAGVPARSLRAPAPAAPVPAPRQPRRLRRPGRTRPSVARQCRCPRGRRPSSCNPRGAPLEQASINRAHPPLEALRCLSRRRCGAGAGAARARRCRAQECRGWRPGGGGFAALTRYLDRLASYLIPVGGAGAVLGLIAGGFMFMAGNPGAQRVLGYVALGVVIVLASKGLAA